MPGPRQELKRVNKQKRRRLLKRRLLALVVLLVLLIIGTIFFLRLDRWQLETILVRGNRVVGEAELIARAERLLSGDYFYLIPHRQRWFYPQTAIEADLLGAFPRLSQVQTYIKDGKLMILVEEHKPAAIWCLGADGPCYFINEQTEVFSLAPRFSRPIYLTITYPDQPPPVPGMAPFDRSILSDLLADREALQEIFDAHWTEPVSLLLVNHLEAEDYRFEVDPSGVGHSFGVMVDLKADRRVVAESLETVLEDGTLIDKLAGHHLSLDYLDLRFAPKVFYRFRD